MSSGHLQGASNDDYVRKVTQILAEILGQQMVPAVLYYTGTPQRSTFEAKLRSVFGGGASMIIAEINKRLP